MKLLNRITLLALATFGLALSSHAASEPKLKPLFNGKDFTNWKVPQPNHNWRIENGIILGENDAKLEGSYLWTEKDYGDFVLELDVRWEGEEIDTGVNLRKPNFQLQMGVSRSLKRDMTGSFMTDGKGDTSRYPEAGRANEFEKYLKKGDWNTFRIEARGNTFKTWINGHKVSEYTNARYSEAGPLGLQFHDGLKMKLQFKNIRIAEL
jgi:hypothetical protein